MKESKRRGNLSNRWKSKLKNMRILIIGNLYRPKKYWKRTIIFSFKFNRSKKENNLFQSKKYHKEYYMNYSRQHSLSC